MLDTLIKIGKWKASNMEPIERFLTKPKDLKEDKIYYVANLVFDLDDHNIYMENYKKYDPDKDFLDFLLLKTLPGHNKAIYASVEKKKITGLLKSFFGKIEKDTLSNTNYGELYLKSGETGASATFLNLLGEITKLRDILLEKITPEKEQEKINPKLLLNEIKVNKSEDIALVVASVKSHIFGFEKPEPISTIEDYKNFIATMFLTEDEENGKSEELCYATGKYFRDVEELGLETRYSLNKMFVTETKNYATGLNKKEFSKNYKVSKKNQAYLDIASNYLLTNYKKSIAGVPHIIIPIFYSKTEVDFDLALNKINQQSDFLFGYKSIEQFNTNITDEIGEEIYWLNFLSIDSNGNYFKSNDLIKDVSKPWFLKIIQTFDDLNIHFSEYYYSKTFYNFYTFYNHIPVKASLKRNEALELFKDIFEYRKIDKDILLKHFTKYLIVQRSGQFNSSNKHKAYSNIDKQNNFDYAIKNGILNYLVFFKFLKKLKLLNLNCMEENREKLTHNEEAKSNYGQRIENFFLDMGYNSTQKALFYLGRVLSQVAYAQDQKNHKNKPVLNKLNYNGMDKDDIVRLRLDLAEKAKQYSIINDVEFNFSQFTHLFNPNKEKLYLNPEENVFYILSGYSFGMIKDYNNEGDNNKEPKKDSEI